MRINQNQHAILYHFIKNMVKMACCNYKLSSETFTIYIVIRCGLQSRGKYSVQCMVPTLMIIVFEKLVWWALLFKWSTVMEIEE